MTNGAGGYTPIIQLLHEIGRAADADATVAALAMIYVGTDTMALLSCPVDQGSQRRSDFIGWVDKYLKADADSEYQYRGMDVYAARCALLHSYGSVADLHRGENPSRIFGYTDNGPHQVDAQVNLALISVAVLVRDFSRAVGLFVQDVKADAELKRRVDSRMHKLLLFTMIH